MTDKLVKDILIDFSDNERKIDQTLQYLYKLIVNEIPEKMDSNTPNSFYSPEKNKAFILGHNCCRNDCLAAINKIFEV